LKWHLKTIAGVVDLNLEQQIPISQIQVKFDRDAASRYGLSVGNIAKTIETALNGEAVSQVLDKQQSFDLVVWLKPESRQNIQEIGSLAIDLPNGTKIPLSSVAKIETGTGPNTINRENVARSLVVAVDSFDNYDYD